MTTGAAHLVVEGLSLYGAVGLLVALAFLCVGLDNVAPLARGAYAFRPLLIPGLVLLWPIVVLRWFAAGRERR